MDPKASPDGRNLVVLSILGGIGHPLSLTVIDWKIGLAGAKTVVVADASRDPKRSTIDAVKQARRRRMTTEEVAKEDEHDRRRSAAGGPVCIGMEFEDDTLVAALRKFIDESWVEEV